MNKHTHMIQKTTPTNITFYTILLIWLRNQMWRPIASQHHISYKTINVLLSCYLYSLTVKEYFTVNNIDQYYHCHPYELLSKYMKQLVSVDMITLARSPSPTNTIKYYKLTQLGYDTIIGISQRADQLLYDYCQKYNIEL